MIKLLTISDYPLHFSGVAHQTRLILEGLLKTGKYQIVSLGGAKDHPNYEPQKINENWTIYPVKNYGDGQVLKKVLYSVKPDALWFMTDPRYFIWLWEMEDEVHQYCPLLYYHVWDNYPAPKFNSVFYESTDFIGCISKLTYDIVCQLGFKNKAEYIPHAVDSNVFKPAAQKDIDEFVGKAFKKEHKNKFKILWDSRNGNRKCITTALSVFKKFNNRIGRDAILILHTNPLDPEGPQVFEAINHFDNKDDIILSIQPMPYEQMNLLYNACDFLISTSNAEGFGLSCVQMLTIGKEVVIPLTGGLQDQITCKKHCPEVCPKGFEKEPKEGCKGYEWGKGISITNKYLIGSQVTPYIYEDRFDEEDFVRGMLKVYYANKNLKKQELKERKEMIRKWSSSIFSIDKMVNSWDKAIEDAITKFKDYQGYRIKKII